MTIRISQLKEAKIKVFSYLMTNYQNFRFGVFYSTGTKEQKFKDQFLKVETNMDEKRQVRLKQEIQDLLNQMGCEGLTLKVTKLINEKK